MEFHRPLLSGIFLKRYKRFFADVIIDGKTITAHCPNSGSMKGVKEENSPCRITFDDNPKRKLKYTLEMIKTPTSWVGVNTHIPNKIVKEAIQHNAINEWNTYDKFQPEVKITEKTRLDFALWNSNDFKDEKIKFKELNVFKTKHKFHFIEVKNVSLAEDGLALFPDAETTRGQKHIEELIHLIEAGHSCELLFTIQRTDCIAFAPADEIDPKYGALLRKAVKLGLKVSPYLCEINQQGIALTTQKLPVVFS